MGLAQLIPLRRLSAKWLARIGKPRGNTRPANITPRKLGLYGWYRPGF
jgi:hypothetical protein